MNEKIMEKFYKAGIEVQDLLSFEPCRRCSLLTLPARLQVLSSLSKSLLQHPQGKNFPGILALGFWLRDANVKSILRRVVDVEHGHRVPRGLVFHIAPSNVESMFVYSWALSFLAGNTNIVRITDRHTEESSIILFCLNQILVKFKIKAEQLFLSYPRNSQISSEISKTCDARVIWGGDQTVKTLMSYETKPHCKNITFADKRSFLLVNSEVFVNSSKKRFAENFLRDAYTFSQMACSSIRTIVFKGEEAVNSEAINNFQELINLELRKSVTEDVSTANEKLKKIFDSILSTETKSVDLLPESSKMTFVSSTNLVGAGPAYHGLFTSISVSELAEIVPLLHEKVQTMSYFGFERSEMVDFLRQTRSLLWIDRIVPVGTSLNFSDIWDGNQLISDLMRIIEVE